MIFLLKMVAATLVGALVGFALCLAYSRLVLKERLRVIRPSTARRIEKSHYRGLREGLVDYEEAAGAYVSQVGALWFIINHGWIERMSAVAKEGIPKLVQRQLHGCEPFPPVIGPVH